MLAQNIHLTEHLAFFQLHYMLLFLVLQSLLLLIAKNQIEIFNFYFTHTIKWFRLLK